MKNFITKFEVKWAFIFVIVSLLWMTFEKMMGWHERPGIANHATYTMIFMIPAILVYVFAMRDVKQNRFEGTMNWKQGFLSGLGITLVVTLLSPLSQYITSEIITPEYFNNVIEYTVTELGKNQTEMEANFNLKNYIMQATIGALIIGIVTSAIVALFVRSK